MKVSDEIRQQLEANLDFRHIEVIDESEQHRGHAGYPEGGQSHFRVVIAADVFGDMSRIERHRAVHTAIGKDLIGRIHALALEITA